MLAHDHVTIWKSNKDNMELVSDTGKVVLDYNAKAVNIVAAGDSTLAIKLDNALIGSSSYGKDVNGAKVQCLQKDSTLVFGQDYGEHMLEIDVEGKGFKLYTFTFG